MFAIHSGSGGAQAAFMISGFSRHLSDWEFPTRTQDELTVFSTALQDIEDGIRGTCLEVCETDRPAEALLATTASGAQSDPFSRLDPFNAVLLAEGRPLVLRSMPHAAVFMMSLAGCRESVQLWNCQGWATGADDDFCRSQRDAGQWGSGMSTVAPGMELSGGWPSLTEVTAEDVIALCNRQGVIPPPQLVNELAIKPAAPGPVADGASTKMRAAESRDLVPRPRRLLLLIHGIRTFAYWQPMVQRVLQEIPETRSFERCHTDI